MTDQSKAGYDAWPPGIVNWADRTGLLSDIETRLRVRQGFALATLNLDHVVKMRRDQAFRGAYAAQTHIVADGNPIVWLRRLARQPVDLMPGSDLVAPLAALAARLDVPVAFLGSRNETLTMAAERLARDIPGLCVVCRIAPGMGYDPDSPQAADDLRAVAESGAGLCFLALGAPKQERLAARGRVLTAEVGFVSIGAGLDFIAGHQQRAPLWVRRISMEWLWRMLSDPGRLAQRYAECALALPGLTRDALRQRKAQRTR